MTLQEAIDQILTDNADSFEKIRDKFRAGATVEQVCTDAHFGYGMALRNKLNLWQPSTAALRQELWDTLTPEKQKFYNDWWKGQHQGSTMHADDASHELLLAALRMIAMTTRVPHQKRGACAKQTVRCTIVHGPGDHRFVGENYCLNPQTACPRQPGEGYGKCVSICQQEGHAEVVAARLAASLGKTGGVAYIEGHTYACEPCKKVLAQVGVTDIKIEKPPAATGTVVWY